MAAHIQHQGILAKLSLLVLFLLQTILSVNAQTAPESFVARSHLGSNIGLSRRHASSWRRAESLDSRGPPSWRRAEPLDVRNNPDWRRAAAAPNPDWRREPALGLEKRVSNARFTWFDTGLGACGGVNSPGDHVVAMSKLDWDGGAHCGKTVTITIEGKSTQATIVDECMGCPSGALDFTTGLFKFFHPNLGDGTLYGEWSYGSAAAPPEPKPTPKPTPKPSPSPSPKPSSKPAKTSSSSTPTSSSDAAQSSSSTPSLSASAAPTATVSPDEPQFLNQLNLAMVDLGSLVVAAAANH
ncbi:hypothetical protein HGRIS_007883 [Hohenbuehelia grisea]|uniref:RlpA-like double-psi beta-barrel-protein domain-containing protein-containing protein n=1 Tax=Hohenbuehelia grisea TaxID=104357 RepID=A0ABR3J683_9AGAR